VLLYDAVHNLLAIATCLVFICLLLTVAMSSYMLSVLNVSWSCLYVVHLLLISKSVVVVVVVVVLVVVVVVVFFCTVRHDIFAACVFCDCYVSLQFYD